MAIIIPNPPNSCNIGQSYWNHPLFVQSHYDVLSLITFSPTVLTITAPAGSPAGLITTQIPNDVSGYYQLSRIKNTSFTHIINGTLDIFARMYQGNQVILNGYYATSINNVSYGVMEIVTPGNVLFSVSQLYDIYIKSYIFNNGSIAPNVYSMTSGIELWDGINLRFEHSENFTLNFSSATIRYGTANRTCGNIGGNTIYADYLYCKGSSLPDSCQGNLYFDYIQNQTQNLIGGASAQDGKLYNSCSHIDSFASMGRI